MSPMRRPSLLARRGAASSTEPALDYARVLHLGDPARAASLLSEAAAGTGRRWPVLPLATAPSGSGTMTALRRAGRGGLWEAQLALRRVGIPRVHVHSALARPHAGWAFGRRFALHLHGTDIRTRRRDPRFRALVEGTVRDAQVVFYSTPDLREHVADLRTDALLVPVPVPVDAVPTSGLPTAVAEVSEGRDVVMFASRWDDPKGGALQIAIARELARAFSRPEDPVLVGLDWGPRAREAEQAGVRLVPTMDHAAYRASLAAAQLVVGQSTGVMGASELDALAMDSPLLMALNPAWYDGSSPSLDAPPVLGGTTLGRLSPGELPAAMAELAVSHVRTEHPVRAQSRDWVADHHGPNAALAHVLEGYRSHAL